MLSELKCFITLFNGKIPLCSVYFTMKCTADIYIEYQNVCRVKRTNINRVIHM